MIKKYNQYLKEKVDHSEQDPFGEEDWDDDHEFNIGDKVTCIHNCVNILHGEYGTYLIKKGEVKIIKGVSRDDKLMYFTDTVLFAGSYETKNFVKSDNLFL